MKTNSCSLTLSFCLLLLLTAMQVRQAAAQRTVTGPTAAPIYRPDSIQYSGLYDYWTMMSAQGRAGGVLLGKLAMEGEPLPWQPLLVAVDCKGSVVNLTQTDLQGKYVITFVETHGPQGIPADAGRQMEVKYEGCVVRASVAGFRSSSITLTIRNLRDDPNLPTITLSPEGRSGGTEISTTTHAAPASAMKAFEKAREDWLNQNPGGAEKNLKKAVQLYPAFAQAWLQLGELQETSDPQAAKDSFTKAMAADPQFVLPYEQLAGLAAQAQNWPGTLDNTSRALELDPDGTPQVWYYDALAKFQMGKSDAAAVSAAKALAVDPRHSVQQSEYLLAVVLIRKADYAAALQHMKNYLSYMPAGTHVDMVKQEIAQLERKVAPSK